MTLPGGGATITTAGAITTVGTFDANNLPVELDAKGAIAGAAFPIINVATLSGSAGAVTLDNANNTVANLAKPLATSPAPSTGIRKWLRVMWIAGLC